MHVVIAGGGVAALEAVIALRDLAGERVDITMLAPEEDFVFKPLSVGEPFALGDAQRLPLKKFARDLSVELAQLACASYHRRQRAALRQARDRDGRARRGAVRIRHHVPRSGGQREASWADSGPGGPVCAPYCLRGSYGRDVDAAAL